MGCCGDLQENTSLGLIEDDNFSGLQFLAKRRCKLEHDKKEMGDLME